jgi:hypothetical protein
MSHRASSNKVKDQFLSDYHRFRDELTDESKVAYDKILLVCATAKKPLRHDELINLSSLIKYFQEQKDGAGLQRIADFAVFDSHRIHTMIQS